MSSELIIMCEKCKCLGLEPSLRQNPKLKHLGKLYECDKCSHKVFIKNLKEYLEKNKPEENRCLSCGKLARELVEKNYRREHQPEDEVTDLYKCSSCGQEVIEIIKESEGCLYG